MRRILSILLLSCILIINFPYKLYASNCNLELNVSDKVIKTNETATITGKLLLSNVAISNATVYLQSQLGTLENTEVTTSAIGDFSITYVPPHNNSNQNMYDTIIATFNDSESQVQTSIQLTIIPPTYVVVPLAFDPNLTSNKIIDYKLNNTVNINSVSTISVSGRFSSMIFYDTFGRHFSVNESNNIIITSYELQSAGLADVGSISCFNDSGEEKLFNITFQPITNIPNIIFENPNFIYAGSQTTLKGHFLVPYYPINIFISDGTLSSDSVQTDSNGNFSISYLAPDKSCVVQIILTAEISKAKSTTVTKSIVIEPNLKPIVGKDVTNYSTSNLFVFSGEPIPQLNADLSSELITLGSAMQRECDLNNNIIKLQNQDNLLEKKLTINKKIFGHILVSYYINNPQDLILHLIFDSKNFSQFVTNINYISLMISKTVNVINNIEDEHRQLDRNKQQILEEKQQCNELMANISNEIAEVSRSNHSLPSPNILSVPSSISYVDITPYYKNISAFLDKENSMESSISDLYIINSAAKQYNINPLLLLAITGQEQSFVPKTAKYANLIINNPWNVFYSWQVFQGGFGLTALWAAHTVMRLAQDWPGNVDIVSWINGIGSDGKRDNPRYGYADDPKWWEGVNMYYQELQQICYQSQLN